MRVLTFVAFDVRNGIARAWWKYLVIFVVTLLFSLALWRDLPREQIQLHLAQTAPTVGDYLVNLVAGINVYVFNSGLPLSLSCVMAAHFFAACLPDTELPLSRSHGIGPPAYHGCW